MGKWGGELTPNDRYAVSLAYRVIQGRAGFMLIDAGSRPTANGKLANKSLKRSEIVGTRLATQAFSVVDTIIIYDTRLAYPRCDPESFP